jgi:hypothetical protein
MPHPTGENGSLAKREGANLPTCGARESRNLAFADRQITVNAREFKSEAIRRGCDEYGMSHHEGRKVSF